MNGVRKDSTADNRQRMVKALTEIKNTLRKFHFEQDRQKSLKLIQTNFNNAKEYWKLLKDSVMQTKPKNLSSSDFDIYFKSINNPDDPFFQPDEDIVYFNEQFFFNTEIQIMFDELNCQITKEEITKAKSRLKMGKAAAQINF